MIQVAYVLLTLAGAGFGYRLLAGPTLADRTTALNGLLIAGMGAIAAHAAAGGSTGFLPALVAAALVGPIGTGMVARFIEGGQRDR